MRPRSFDRGKPDVGRVFAAIRTASMRPRSFDRGKSQRVLVPTLRNTASMRPRSFDRGKSTTTRGSVRWGIGFNEAAIIRSRKDQAIPIAAERCGDGFNEAAIIRSRKGTITRCRDLRPQASMRPRSFDRGKGQISKKPSFP